ncbi:MAG: hypothetical protein WA624_05410 [Methylocella sp.]
MAEKDTAVDRLTEWFDGLERAHKEEVVRFLYGGRVLLKEGMYLGPHPDAVIKGLHCGPIPALSTRVCPTCGKPY